MITAMSGFFTKTFQFRGRATRKDFWIPNIVLGLLGVLMSGSKLPQKWENIIGGMSVLPALSLTSRRYQDAGVSGWFQVPQLLSFLLLPLLFMRHVKRWVKAMVITIAGLFNIMGFILTLLPSDDDNKYGERPG